VTGQTSIDRIERTVAAVCPAARPIVSAQRPQFVKAEQQQNNFAYSPFPFHANYSGCNASVGQNKGFEVHSEPVSGVTSSLPVIGRILQERAGMI
jgi:hypothetical protein